MIVVTHGVVDALDPRRISHALMLSRRAFIRHLQQRPVRYVPIEQAALGLGDALTVDDATLAGLDQVLLARRFGHAVTWFVNGQNVEQHLPYFPFLLSWMLDETTEPACLFHGRFWPLRTLPERKAFRRFLKLLYMGFTADQQILDLIEELTCHLNLPDPGNPSFLATASRQHLEHAVRAGVVLGNHGWDHLNPLALSPSTCVAGIKQNRAWLETLQPDRGIYAPPYGARVPLPPDICSLMLLADPTLANPILAETKEPSHERGILNRSPLHLDSNTIFSKPLDPQSLSLMTA